MKIKVTLEVADKIISDIYSFSHGESKQEIDKIVNSEIIPGWINWNWEEVEEE